MCKEKRYAIGLDLGGTKILASLIDQTGNITSQVESPTLREQGGKAVTERILTVLGELIETSSIQHSSIIGVGIATAGVIDTNNNEIVFASNLDMENVPIGKLIDERYHLPVKLCNDANAAAVAEWVWGAGVHKTDIIYITVSTGVGAGIISDNRLVTGIGNSAGEFGHISIMPNGPVTSYGNRGILEDYASGTAIANTVKQRLKTGEKSAFFAPLLEKEQEITAKGVGYAAQSGDKLAIDVLNEASYYLGIGITNLIHLFNPELIILGGGVMNQADIMIPRIQETVRKLGIPSMVDHVQFVKSTIGKEAGVKGGAGLFFQSLKSSPAIHVS